jgi:hypothetical protein
MERKRVDIHRQTIGEKERSYTWINVQTDGKKDVEKSTNRCTNEELIQIDK